MMISPLDDMRQPFFNNVQIGYSSPRAGGNAPEGQSRGTAPLGSNEGNPTNGQDSQGIDGRRLRLPTDKPESWKEKYGISDDKDQEECQTCKNRKYKDGSDEMVSFKSPQHVSPENAASAVRAHEQEHVSNAYKKAAMNDGKVISASVSIHTGICPECGRTYVSGGTTHTQIKYYNEDNPYQQNLKSADRTKYEGMNLDHMV